MVALKALDVEVEEHLPVEAEEILIALKFWTDSLDINDCRASLFAQDDL